MGTNSTHSVVFVGNLEVILLLHQHVNKLFRDMQEEQCDSLMLHPHDLQWKRQKAAGVIMRT